MDSNDNRSIEEQVIALGHQVISSPTSSSVDVSTPPNYSSKDIPKLTVDTLKDDDNWINAAHTTYRRLYGSDFDGSKDDIADWAKGYSADQRHNFSSITFTAMTNPASWTTEEKESYNYLVQTYGNTDIDFWQDSKQILRTTIFDFMTYASIGLMAASSAPISLSILGLGFIYRNMIVGAIQGFTQNYLEQSVAIDTGRQEEFNILESSLSTGLGMFGDSIIGGIFSLGKLGIKTAVRKFVPESIERFIVDATTEFESFISHESLIKTAKIASYELEKRPFKDRIEILNEGKKLARAEKKTFERKVQKGDRADELRTRLVETETALARLTLEQSEHVTFQEMQVKLRIAKQGVNDAEKALRKALSEKADTLEAEAVLRNARDFLARSLTEIEDAGFVTSTRILQNEIRKTIATTRTVKIAQAAREYGYHKRIAEILSDTVPDAYRYTKDVPVNPAIGAFHRDDARSLLDIDGIRATEAGLGGNENTKLKTSSFYTKTEGKQAPAVRSSGYMGTNSGRLEISFLPRTRGIGYNVPSKDILNAQAFMVVQQLASKETGVLQSIIQGSIFISALTTEEREVLFRSLNMYTAFLKSHLEDTKNIRDFLVEGAAELYTKKIADLQKRLDITMKATEVARRMSGAALEQHKKPLKTTVEKWIYSASKLKIFNQLEMVYQKAINNISKIKRSLAEKKLRLASLEERNVKQTLQLAAIKRASTLFEKPAYTRRYITTRETQLLSYRKQIKLLSRDNPELKKLQRTVKRLEKETAEAEAHLARKADYEQSIADINAEIELINADIKIEKEGMRELTKLQNKELREIKKLEEGSLTQIQQSIEDAYRRGDTALAQENLAKLTQRVLAEQRKESEGQSWGMLSSWWDNTGKLLLEIAISNVFSLTTIALNAIPSAISLYTMPITNVLFNRPWSMRAWREASAHYSVIHSSFKSAWYAAKESFRYEHSLLSSTSRIFSDQQLQLKGTFGGVFRFIPRMLTATDEFLSRVGYSTYISNEIANNMAVNLPQGLSNSEVKERITAGVQRRLNEDASTAFSFVETAAPIVQKGINQGYEGEALNDYLTAEMARGKFKYLKSGTIEGGADFTDDLLYKSMRHVNKNGNVQQLLRFLDSSPALKLVTGTFFTRSLANTIEVGLRFTPVLNLLLGSFRKDLAGMNGVLRQAQANTSLLLGQATMFASIMGFAKGNITGGRHAQDYQYQKLTRDSGDMPNYSIRLANGTTWSYDKVPAFGTAMKLMVSLLEYAQDLGLRQSQGEDIKGPSDYFAELASGVQVVVSSVFTNDHPLFKGAKDVYELFNIAKGESNESAVIYYIGSKVALAVPRTVTQLLSPQETLRTNLTLGDATLGSLGVTGAFDLVERIFQSKFREGQDQLTIIRTPYAYDALGNRRPTRRKAIYSTFSDFMREEERTSHLNETQVEVMEKLLRLSQVTGASFRTPLKIDGSPDLRSMLTADGTMTMYDKLNEIYKSLEPEILLAKVLGSRRSIGTRNVNGSMIEAVHRIRNSYYKRAFRLLMRDEEELSAIMYAVNRHRVDVRRGVI